MTSGQGRGGGAAIRIACPGLALAVFLVGLRAQVAFGWADLRAPLRLLGHLAVAAYADLAYVTALVGVFLGLSLLAAGRPRTQRVVVGLFAASASFSLLLGFVNVRAVEELGRPINYQWLYYSHFMRSTDSYTALASLLSWKWTGTVAAAWVALWILWYCLVGGTQRLVRRFGTQHSGATLAGAPSAYFVLVWPWHSRPEWREPAFENPVMTRDSAAVLEGRDRLAAWVQYQSQFYQGMFGTGRGR
jgi:hypothetical protein